MFFSNNLLFLVSLAFVSWVILCYLNKMDGGRDLPICMDYGLLGTNISEKSFENAVATSEPAANQVPNYEMYINFFCIFSCIYVLAKLISLSEDFLTAQLRSTVGRCHVCNDGGGDATTYTSSYRRTRRSYNQHLYDAIDISRTPFTMNDYYSIGRNMREEITRLQKRNAYLEARMRDLEQYNLLLMGKNLLRASETEMQTNGNSDYVVFTCRATESDCNTEPQQKEQGEEHQSNDNNINNINVNSDMPTLETSTSSISNATATANTNEIITNDGTVIENIPNVNGNEVSIRCLNPVCTFICNDEIDGENTGSGNGGIVRSDRLMNGQIVKFIAARYPRQRNIFIANRFVHLNRQVYINEGNVKLTIQSSDGCDFTQIWEKYLGMQHYKISFSRRAQQQQQPTTSATSTETGTGAATTSQSTTTPPTPSTEPTNIQTPTPSSDSTLPNSNDFENYKTNDSNMGATATDSANTTKPMSKIKINLNGTVITGDAKWKLPASHPNYLDGDAKPQTSNPKPIFITTEELESMQGFM